MSTVGTILEQIVQAWMVQGVATSSDADLASTRRATLAMMILQQHYASVLADEQVIITRYSRAIAFRRSDFLIMCSQYRDPATGCPLALAKRKSLALQFYRPHPFFRATTAFTLDEEELLSR